ncbi:MAG: radical SAM protein [Parachlamydiaceae bacterium]|nr:radical SAM protein [Parachlamydiaceae bacterium]
MKNHHKTLQLIEIFASIQGETRFSGLPTTFIRLAACNLRCSWCDTTYSFGRGDTWEIDVIIQKVIENGCKYVCITGGEPLLQSNVHLLMKELCDLGYQLSIETGGSLSTEAIDPRVTVILDIKCPGSGMHEKNYWANLPHLRPDDEVKFVISHEEDYLYAKDICLKYQLFEKVNNVLFSPVFNVLHPQKLVEWILKDKLSSVRLNLQLHKFIWDPLTKGV